MPKESPKMQGGETLVMPKPEDLASAEAPKIQEKPSAQIEPKVPVVEEKPAETKSEQKQSELIDQKPPIATSEQKGVINDNQPQISEEDRKIKIKEAMLSKNPNPVELENLL